METPIITDITEQQIVAAEKCLIDNGIDVDEADTVLQAIGYILLDINLYPSAYEVEYLIAKQFNGSGTYNIHFGDNDETQFYAETSEDMVMLWIDFCYENDFDVDSFYKLEFVCEEDI